MAEYRIDDLAREAGTTVRNVRAYQDKRLLPKPRIEGRVALYDEGHLARLKLVGQMLQRGFSLAQIEELISALAQGRDLADVLGLEAQVLTPWSEEVAQSLSKAELEVQMGSPVTPAQISNAVKSGLIEPTGEGRYVVRSPKLLNVAAQLLAAGVALDAVLDLGGTIANATDEIAKLILDAVVPNIFPELETGELPSGDELNSRAELVQRLRPLAQTAIDAYLARSMEQQVKKVLVSHWPKPSPG